MSRKMSRTISNNDSRRMLTLTGIVKVVNAPEEGKVFNVMSVKVLGTFRRSVPIFSRNRKKGTTLLYRMKKKKIATPIR